MHTNKMARDLHKPQPMDDKKPICLVTLLFKSGASQTFRMAKFQRGENDLFEWEHADNEAYPARLFDFDRHNLDCIFYEIEY